MKMMMNKFLAGSLLLLIVQNATALNLQGYRFTDSYRYSLLDDSLIEKFNGRYVVTASYGHIHSPFYYSDTHLHNKQKNIININNVFTTGFSYYLNQNVSLGLDLNAVHNQTFGESHTSLADSVVKSRINLKRTKTFSLSVNPQVFIPTGKGENFSSMNSVGGSLNFVAEKSFKRLHLLASVGGLSAKNNEYEDVDHRQLLLTQLGVSYDATEKWNVNLESYRNFPLVQDTLQDEGKYFVTAKHKTHQRFSTYFGVGASGVSEVNRDTYSGFVGVKIHEPAASDVVAMTAAAPVRVVPINDIYFGHDKATADETELATLQDYINYLNATPPSQVVLEGHASASGPAPYNMALSERRAEHVKSYLVEHGVPADLLTVEPRGESEALTTDSENDRRVHLRIQE